MRKRQIAQIRQAGTPDEEGWLDLDSAAMVEVTSQETDYPVECALVSGEERGWRAAASGAQTIRLIFDQPQSSASRLFSKKPKQIVKSLSCDGLRTAETRFEKLCASSGILASPTPRERSDVTVLELVVVPDISRGAARASLKSLRVP